MELSKMAMAVAANRTGAKLLTITRFSALTISGTIGRMLRKVYDAGALADELEGKK